MKMIKLVPALELGNKLNVDVMDFPGAPEADLPAGAGVLPRGADAPSEVTGVLPRGVDAPPEVTGVLPDAAGEEDAGSTAALAGVLAGSCRKRCGITLEYAPRDIRELQAQGMDREDMIAYYRQRIYDLVKVNISQDWACVGGMDEIIGILQRHI